jgi:alpha-galactosidase
VEPITTFEVDPTTARVHEHGWQSWTPTATYRLDEAPHRSAHELFRVLHCRAEAPDPGPAFQGDGLLAVDDGHGRIHVLAAPDGRREVPTIRAEVEGPRVTIRADAEVEHLVDESGGGIEMALARWADTTVERLGLGAVRPAPTVWCSWYHYYTEVTEADVDENLEAIGHHELPVEVVQLDDGYQAEIGDWLTLSDRFASVADMVGRIRAAGRRAGIWLAPFLVGERSRLAAEHPDWLIGGAEAPVSAGHNWEQDLAALDVTHPDAAAYLTRVITRCAPGAWTTSRSTSSTRARCPGAGTPATTRWPPTATASTSSATPSATTPTCWAAARRCCPASARWTRCV